MRYLLGPGSVIGEVSVIARSPRTATVRGCLTFVHLLSLSASAIDTALERFPRQYAMLRYSAKLRYVDMMRPPPVAVAVAAQE